MLLYPVYYYLEEGLFKAKELNEMDAGRRHDTGDEFRQ